MFDLNALLWKSEGYLSKAHSVILMANATACLVEAFGQSQSSLAALSSFRPNCSKILSGDQMLLKYYSNPTEVAPNIVKAFNLSSRLLAPFLLPRHQDSSKPSLGH